MKLNTKEKLIAVRVIPSQNDELDRYSNLYSQTKSDLIREAIQIWLNLQWQKESKLSEGNDNAVA